MRILLAAVLAMTTSAAVADDIEDAHKDALAGRDSYWNCLAREYSLDSNKSLSGFEQKLGTFIGAAPTQIPQGTTLSIGGKQCDCPQLVAQLTAILALYTAVHRSASYVSALDLPPEELKASASRSYANVLHGARAPRPTPGEPRPPTIPERKKPLHHTNS